MSTLIIVFLGNPGRRYEDTRHNLGWWVGDLMAQEAKVAFHAGRGRFLLAEVRVGGEPALLVKPTTYMNGSGEALADLSTSHEIDPGSLLVVADDFALALGQIRIRERGSSGGHNGLESIIEQLGSDEFARIRCGVGPVPEGVDAAHFVLDRMGPEELIVAREMAAKAARAVAMILARGVRTAANEYNRKPPALEEPSRGSTGAERPKEGA